MILSCISLMTDDIKYLFVYILVFTYIFCDMSLQRFLSINWVVYHLIIELRVLPVVWL